MIHIIAFTGLMGSGKTTAAHFTSKIISELDYNCQVFKFAGILYEYHDLFSLTKNRKFLQDLGDLTRRYFGETCFAKALVNKIINTAKTADYKNKDTMYFIIDDLRYLVEAEHLFMLQSVLSEKSCKIDIIFIDALEGIRRERIPNTFVNSTHSSEQDIPKILEAYPYKRIENNYTKLPDFTDAVLKTIASILPKVATETSENTKDTKNSKNKKDTKAKETVNLTNSIDFTIC